jgi:thiol-disulfide isomerase/thioredoxin
MSSDARTGPATDQAPPPEPAPAGRSAKRPRPIFLLIGVALAVALGIGLFSSFGGSSKSGRPGPGDAVPHFSLPKLVGSGTVRVTADGGSNGKAAILLFFASWCAPCQGEIPALAATVRNQPAAVADRVATIGIDGSDPPAAAMSFVHSAGVTFPVGVDATFQVTSGLFYFTGLPEAVAVEANGTIKAIHYGALSTAEFEAWQRALATSATSPG